MELHRRGELLHVSPQNLIEFSRVVSARRDHPECLRLSGGPRCGPRHHPTRHATISADTPFVPPKLPSNRSKSHHHNLTFNCESGELRPPLRLPSLLSDPASSLFSGSTRIRRMRVGSARRTVRRWPSTSTLSPVLASRPSRSRIRPPAVSASVSGTATRRPRPGRRAGRRRRPRRRRRPAG